MSITHYLTLAIALFSIGLIGVVLRRNLLVAFMSIELMLNGANLSFIAFSRYLGDMQGQMAAFFIVILAAAEAAVGLAIIVLLFRRQGSVQSSVFQNLKDKVGV
ncbi:MAG: NADH-quinone oxidoreductase subunit NuoK [Deltaproteobacteria bacterium]|nr:NADH-quinone oxidoreductase subunit NuoK [Deltaproteobacteria bacterium]